MVIGGVDEVDVVTVGEDSGVSESRGFEERLPAAPRLDDNILRQALLEDLVPPDHPLAVFRQDGQDPLVKIALQGQRALVAFLIHESDDLRVGEPVLAVVFVATDVDELVVEELGHLGHQGIQELISLLDRWIDCGIKDPPAALDLVGPGSARKFGISGEPGAAVAR